MAPSLTEQLLALHRALQGAEIPHAFGGAIALAYYTLEPRGTRDLDINIFLEQADCDAALAALPAGVERPAERIAQIRRDGQARLWWHDTPVDVFFNNLPIHRQAARSARHGPFAGADIPILGPVELAVFKAMFDRTKDWADIEAMVAAQAVDLEAVRASLHELLPATDVRFGRLEEAARRGTAQLGDG